jgi:hypothetical protein
MRLILSPSPSLFLLPPSPAWSRKDINVPCVQVPERETEKQNSNYDTELEKLETHIMIMASDIKMHFWKIISRCPTEL